MAWQYSMCLSHDPVFPRLNFDSPLTSPHPAHIAGTEGPSVASFLMVTSFPGGASNGGSFATGSPAESTAAAVVGGIVQTCAYTVPWLAAPTRAPDEPNE